MSDIVETHSTGGVNETKLLEAYIQKPEKMSYYQRGLEKMQQAGIFGFRWHWSWWAFFFGWAFLLYRKAYIPALVAFIVTMFLNFIPFGFLVAMIGLGGVSSYFVLKRFNDLKNSVKGTEDEQVKAMYSFGGYHTWVIWVIAILYSLALLGMFMFAGIMIGSEMHSY